MQVFRSHTHSVVIRFSWPRPRVGLVAEGPPPVPLGFIVCDVGIPLQEVHGEIQRQLPSLYSTLVAVGYTLLDSSGWPIARDQESVLSLAETLSNMALSLRLHRPPTSDTAETNSTQLTALPGPAHSLSDSTHSIVGGSAHFLPRPLVEESADMAESSFLNQSMNSYSAAVSSSPGVVQPPTLYMGLYSYILCRL